MTMSQEGAEHTRKQIAGLVNNQPFILLLIDPPPAKGLHILANRMDELQVDQIIKYVADQGPIKPLFET